MLCWIEARLVHNLIYIIFHSDIDKSITIDIILFYLFNSFSFQRFLELC